jgi:glycosyltransferase involved in cell wall biosynthesis
MRICAVAHNLLYAGGRSVGRNITAVLPKVAPDHTYLMIVPEGRGYEMHEGRENVAVRQVPVMGTMKRAVFDLVSLPKLVSGFEPDWLWVLGNVPLLSTPCPQALLIHDSHLVYPTYHYELEPFWLKFRKHVLKRRLRAGLRKVDVIFCQTQTMRRRFAETFDFGEDRIGLLPNAVSGFSRVSECPAVPDALQPHRDRFKLLMLARYWAYKNVEGIIEAYTRYGVELADTLVVTTLEPAQHPRVPGVLAEIRRRGLETSVLNIGPVPHEHVGDYYLACDALLLPTLLESFSGTYLEAMHYNRPIVTSDLDFAREVCGDAALYFDPWDPAAMKDAIVRIRDDAALRETLVQRGRERLKGTYRSWEQAVAEALDFLGIPRAPDAQGNP